MATMLAPMYGPEENGPASQGADYFTPRIKKVPNDVRSFPNEDIFFWRKSLDNSRVVRQANPHDWETAWRFVSAASLILVVVIGLLLPNAVHLLSGIQEQQLKTENTRLQDERRVLEAEEGRLLSPERMQALAAKLGMKPATAARVVHLGPVGEESVAKAQPAGR